MQINIEISEDEIKQEILKYVVLNAIEEPQKIKSSEHCFYLIPWVRERFDKIATKYVHDYLKEFGKDQMEEITKEALKRKMTVIFDSIISGKDAS